MKTKPTKSVSVKPDRKFDANLRQALALAIEEVQREMRNELLQAIQDDDLETLSQDDFGQLHLAVAEGKADRAELRKVIFQELRATMNYFDVKNLK